LLLIGLFVLAIFQLEKSMNNKYFMALVLLIAPIVSMADDTRCTTEISEVKIGPSGRSFVGNLAIRGTTFNGSYIPIFTLDQPTPTEPKIDTGSIWDPDQRVFTDAALCDRWLTVTELALALDMKVVLGYDSIAQPDCERLNDEVYPQYVEVHKNESKS
jgi:hypothetical protein